MLKANIAAAVQTIEQLASLEPEVNAAANAIAAALLSGRKLMACGNGGSAADASHLTTEFVVRYDRDRRGYPAISLAANAGDLTAGANDYGYAEVFARQVQAYGQSGDILAAFTTSGKSKNILRALQTAKALNLTTIAFLGRDGGKCAGLASIEFLVKSNVTARIQEAHKFLLHTICELVDQELA